MLNDYEPEAAGPSAQRQSHATAGVSGSNAMLLPDEVLSMIMLQLDKADLRRLQQVSRRLRWLMMQRQLARTGTAGTVIAALQKLVCWAPRNVLRSDGAAILACKVDISKGDHRCSMHCVHQSITQRHYLEANLVQSMQPQPQPPPQPQQQQQQRSVSCQMSDGVAARLAGATSSAVTEQVAVELHVTFVAAAYGQAEFMQQYLLQGGLLDFLLRVLPATVQLELQLQYLATLRAGEQPKPFFSMQAHGRRAPQLALAAQCAHT